MALTKYLLCLRHCPRHIVSLRHPGLVSQCFYYLLPTNKDNQRGKKPMGLIIHVLSKKNLLRSYARHTLDQEK